MAETDQTIALAAPTLADIEAAHARIKERVRQTPAITARVLAGR